MEKSILKNRRIIITVIFAFFMIDKTAAAAILTNYKQPLKVGDKLSIPNIGLKSNTYIDDLASEDVTGDLISDFLILAGVKGDRSNFSYEHTVIIQDGSSRKYLTLQVGHEGGYDGKLSIGDLNGDKVADIMVGAATGGSGGTYNYSILTFAGGKPGILISQNALSTGAQFKGHFKDGFKAEITSVDFDKTVEIDISSSKKDYADNKVYDNNGKLLKPVDVNADGFQLLKLVDTDDDGVYELEGYQRLWGFCHVDNVSNARTTWKIESCKLVLQALELSTFVY